MSAKDLEFNENTSLAELKIIKSNLYISTAYGEVDGISQSTAGIALKKVVKLIKEKEGKQ